MFEHDQIGKIDGKFEESREKNKWKLKENREIFLEKENSGSFFGDGLPFESFDRKGRNWE